MRNEAEVLRAELVRICEKRVTGDLNEKKYQKVWTERTVDLYKVIVKEHLRKGETVVLEHHLIQSHFKFTQSVLKEPEQMAVSLFATENRLIRLRSMVRVGEAPRCDESDRTVIDDVNYDQIVSLKKHRQIKKSEMLAGLVIIAVSLLLYPWLKVTGPFMIALGVLGFLHGFVMPVSWYEIVIAEASSEKEPIAIHLPRKKSARQLLAYIRARHYRG